MSGLARLRCWGFWRRSLSCQSSVNPPQPPCPLPEQRSRQVKSLSFMNWPKGRPQLGWPGGGRGSSTGLLGGPPRSVAWRRSCTLGWRQGPLPSMDDPHEMSHLCMHPTPSVGLRHTYMSPVCRIKHATAVCVMLIRFPQSFPTWFSPEIKSSSKNEITVLN